MDSQATLDLGVPDRVVHCHSASYDVYVGRPSKWGNPFVLGLHGNRTEVIRQFREWIQTQPTLLADLPELRGKVLGCWCRPHACHADVLVALANTPLSPNG